jgi:hypothetical protein
MFSHRSKPARTRQRSFRPTIEALEGRLVPAITDMTDLAWQTMNTPDAPTHLYLNFDGFKDDTHSVAPFDGNFDQINDIVFRVAEIYSPFNVEVSRRDGFNNYDTGNGSSTVFIGDDSANTTTNPDGSITNLIHGYTPGEYTDSPSTAHPDHVPRSNPFNLAFVDPVGADGVFRSHSDTDGIVSAIAHETGHTFGLGHVVTHPIHNMGDMANQLLAAMRGETPPEEIMSYDSPNTLFVDQTFELTDQNFDGTTTKSDPGVVPTYQGTPLQTQNSFTYLQQVLGNRPGDGFRHVVHPALVDPRHLGNTSSNWRPYTTYTGTVDREGDYVVYQAVNMLFDWQVQIDLTPADGSDFADLPGRQPDRLPVRPL